MEFKKFDPSDDVLDEFNLKVTEDAADCFRFLLIWSYTSVINWSLQATVNSFIKKLFDIVCLPYTFIENNNITCTSNSLSVSDSVPGGYGMKQVLSTPGLSKEAT